MSIHYLYKYGSINKYSKTLFSSNKLYFAAPSELNDPFECRPLFTFDGTAEQIMEWHVGMMRKQNPKLPEEEARAIAEQTHESGGYKNPEAWQTISKDIVDKLSKEIGLFCMSEKNDDILMSSHYGDDHKGYCLQFKATDDTPVFGAAQQVSYQDDYPVVDFFNTPNDAQVQRIFLTKFSDWRYEREWRIVEHKHGRGIYSYPKELLTGVIFGMHMQDCHKKKIRKWLKARGHEVKLFQARRQADKFSLAIEPFAPP